MTRYGVVHARVLADLLEGLVVADAEDDDGRHRHHEEVDDDVGVEVVRILPQVRHLKRYSGVCCIRRSVYWEFAGNIPFRAT